MKNKKTRVGVIIQGPLLTFGDGPNNAKHGFNSFKTIEANYRNITKQAYPCVLSSWYPTNQIETEVLEKLRRLKIPILLNHSPQLDDPYNAYKQRLSMKYGYDYLRKLGVNYFVKIRTDMLMPVSFWSWLKSQSDQNSGHLLVSELLRDEPYYLGDFVVAGSQKVFKNYFSAILSQKSKVFFPLSTYDAGFKYLNYLGKISINSDGWQPLKTYYYFLTRFDYLRNAWNDFLEKGVSVLPSKIWRKIEWRDKVMEQVVKADPFKFDTWPELRSKSIFKQFVLLTDSYIRIWNKRNSISGQPIRMSLTKSYQLLLFGCRLVRSLLHRVLIKLGKPFRRPTILGRVSCIGRDVLKVKYTRFSYWLQNHQKVRLDLLLEWARGFDRPKASQLQKYIPRADIFPLIQNQEQVPWLTQQSDFDYLVIDSFSELTDKKFTHKKDHWSFCCHYGDIEHSPEFEAEFECQGLLPESEFEGVYKSFFSWFEQQFPSKKVVFLHAPADLDTRPLYKKRARKIRTIIDRLAASKTYLYSIHLPSDQVEFNPVDSLPYHFSQRTYFAFAKKWHMMDRTLVNRRT